jgi:hypothetical protein
MILILSYRQIKSALTKLYYFLKWINLIFILFLCQIFNSILRLINYKQKNKTMKEYVKIGLVVLVALALKDIIGRLFWDKTLESILPSSFESLEDLDNEI